jgi:hypothetical protein
LGEAVIDEYLAWTGTFGEFLYYDPAVLASSGRRSPRLKVSG